jgi:glycine oxidase
MWAVERCPPGAFVRRPAPVAPNGYHHCVGSNPDVVVIGAGVIGCAVAYELARRGAAVRVLETRAIGAGATKASAGVLAPRVEVPGPGPLLDLTERSLAGYDTFVDAVSRDSGLPIEFRRCGTLEVAGDEAASQRLRARASAGAEWIPPERIPALEPALSEASAGGLLIPDHGYVAAAALTEALAWAAVRHGAQIDTHRRIQRVEARAGDVQVAADDGSACSAAHAVIAAGSWSGLIGFDEPAAKQVRPVRGQLLRLAWTGPPPGHVIWADRCYVVPWRDGTVLVGATVEDVGFDERTTAAGVRDLLDAACELLPQAWTATFVEARSGLRPATTDGLPILGPSPSHPAVVYATGHYRNGILLAPITARLIADLLTGGRPDPTLGAFSPRRFQ